MKRARLHFFKQETHGGHVLFLLLSLLFTLSKVNLILREVSMSDFAERLLEAETKPLQK